MGRQRNANVPEDGYISKKQFNDTGSIAKSDFAVVADLDNTKKMVFDPTSMSPGKTFTIAAPVSGSDITITMPSASGTLVTSTGEVTSVSKSGAAQLVGDITFTGTTNITLTQTAQNIDVSVSGTVATATSATNAVNVATTAVSNNATYYPLMVAASANGNQAADLATGLTFNPNTNTLTTTTVAAALTGTASGNTSYTANQYGVVLSGAANVMSVLAPDASTTKVLTCGGVSANPTWQPAAVAPALSNIAYIYEDYAQNTNGNNGVAFVAATWTDRNLNLKNDPGSIITTLSSKIFTLPAGTYEISAKSTMFNGGHNALRLYNNTDSAVQNDEGTNPIVGNAAYSASNDNTFAFLEGRFVLAGAKGLKLQHVMMNAGGNAYDGGTPLNQTSTRERYTLVRLSKIA